MSRVVHYVVVRYRPTPELSEFANVGVVALDADGGQISYKLAPRRFGRVTQFFDNIAVSVYSEVIKVLDGELSRLSQVTSMRHGNETSRHLFLSFVQPREGIITFSKVRSLIAASGGEAVKMLYARDVRRDPELLAQKELTMVRNIRTRLQKENIYEFRSRQIEDDLMPVRLPLVSERRERAAIKPLAFDQKTTIGIIDHANVWRDRFLYLFDKELLRPHNVLMALQPPSAFADGSMEEAYELARARIAETGATLAIYDPADVVPTEVVAFAARFAAPQPRLVS